MAQLHANEAPRMLGWRKPPTDNLEGKPEAICRVGGGVNGALLVPSTPEIRGRARVPAYTVRREYGHIAVGDIEGLKDVANLECPCGEHGHWEAGRS